MKASECVWERDELTGKWVWQGGFLVIGILWGYAEISNPEYRHILILKIGFFKKSYSRIWIYFQTKKPWIDI